jgi:integrase
MYVQLKGLHTSKKKLADGSTRTYYYAWKNGPAIKAAPGTKEFIAEFNEHRRKAANPDPDIVSSIIAHYKATELPKLSEATKRDYLRYIKEIEERFGDMPLAAVEERGSRAMFLDWRQEMAGNPRKADLAWSVLQRIFSVALDQERITRNPCKAAGRLAETGTRRQKIWTPADQEKLKKVAPKRILEAFLLAIWTGQRQGDLLELTWSAYDGKHIRLKQSKTGRNVTVKVAKELKTVLDRKRAELAGKDIAALTILTTERGKPWTSDGFRTTWGKVVAKTNIKGLTFHDLRGTFITEARRAGSSIDDIAEASGHSVSDVRSILEEHYLADNNQASDGVILKLERKRK